jgi:riboflavin kinase/FMN adenylyltransferase
VNIYTNLEHLDTIKNPILTIGTYDGVHLGHQKIITFLNAKAEKIDGESVVFTFHPHPRMVLHPNDHNLELLQTIDERIKKLENAGVKHLIVFPFTKEFSKLSATEFIRDILVNKIGIHTLVVGYDHHFGRNREGSMDQLEELAPIYNFETEEISAFMKDEVKISSTKIRKALQVGDVLEATKYLGEEFEISGTVVKGDQIGTKIDFPTANIEIKENYKLIPVDGVYVVKILFDEKIFSGMLNIGNRPTINNKREKTIEVNIFNFKGDLYGKVITLKFIKMIRKEKVFANLDELKEQLIKDEDKCKAILIDFSNPTSIR